MPLISLFRGKNSCRYCGYESLPFYSFLVEALIQKLNLNAFYFTIFVVKALIYIVDKNTFNLTSSQLKL